MVTQGSRRGNLIKIRYITLLRYFKFVLCSRKIWKHSIRGHIRTHVLNRQSFRVSLALVTTKWLYELNVYKFNCTNQINKTFFLCLKRDGSLQGDIKIQKSKLTTSWQPIQMTNKTFKPEQKFRVISDPAPLVPFTHCGSLLSTNSFWGCWRKIRKRQWLR